MVPRMIRGVMYMMEVIGSILEQNGLDRTTCAREGVTDRHVIRVTIKYMEENPASLHLEDSTLVAMALMDAYPCIG